MPQSALKRVRAIWAGEWSEAYQIGLRPCLLCQAGLFFATAAGREPATSASKAVLYPVELRGQPRERRSFCSGSEVASGLSQALAPCYIRRFYCEHCRLRAYTVILCLG